MEPYRMSAEAQSRRHLLDGAARVLLGEALFFPTGLLIVAFLTRRLGPEGYGVLALAMAPVLGEPALTPYRRLFALDVPLVTVIHAHRSLLVGAGGRRFI